MMNAAVAARWLTWPNTILFAPVPILTAVTALITWRSFESDTEVIPFIGAIVLFILSYADIAISLYPMIVPYKLTLWEASSSPRTQAFLLVGTLFLLPIILTYSGWSYWVFRGKARTDIGIISLAERVQRLTACVWREVADPFARLHLKRAQPVTAIAGSAPQNGRRNMPRRALFGDFGHKIARCARLDHKGRRR